MAVREIGCLAVTWRKSSVSTNDETCVQVAVWEAPPEPCEERVRRSEPLSDRA